MKLIDIFNKIVDNTLPPNYKFKMKEFDDYIFSVNVNGFVMWRYTNGNSNEFYSTCISKNLFNTEVEEIK